MNETIKIGVLGCANIAKRLVIPSIQQAEGYDLVAVASRDSRKAQSYADQFNCEAVIGYDALIDRRDIDAIYMPLPTGMHHEWGIKCLESGKHLLSEKSLTTSFSSASAMVDVARKNNKNLLENFMFKYHSQHDFVRDKIRNGAIGEVRGFRSCFGFPPFSDKKNIRYQKNLGGGALLDAGAYTLKVAQMFLGDQLEVTGAHLNHDIALGVDVSGNALLVNPDGVVAEAAWGFHNFYQCFYEIWGSEGKIIAERAYTAPPGFKPKVIIEKQDQRLEYMLSADNHFIKILQHFHRSIVERNLEANFSELLSQAKLLERVLNYENTPN